MIALSEHRVVRIAVLCALYVAQGIPFGFLTVTLAATLVEGGSDTKEIATVFALGTLPWAFKWVWGPFVDRFGSTRFGRRRPWILAAQAGMVGSLVGMWAIPDPTTALGVLGTLIVVHNVFNSLQDVCVDALAIDLLPPGDRGKASGLMYGAKYLGTAIGGAGLSILAFRLGIHAAFAAMVILVAGIALLPLLTVERPGERLWPGGSPDREAPTDGESSPAAVRPPASVAALLLTLVQSFGNRAAIVTGVVALIATGASGLLGPFAAVLFVGDLGWTQEQYGAATGGAAVIAGLAGSVGGGFLADLLGPRRIIALASGLLGVLLLIAGLQVIPSSLRDVLPGSVGSDPIVASASAADESPRRGLEANELDEPPTATEGGSERESETGSSPLPPRHGTYLAYFMVEALLIGAINAAFFAVCFGLCRPEVAATQFTAYMALMNLGMAGLQYSAGILEPHVGVSEAWSIGAGIQFLVIVLLPLTLATTPITVVGRRGTA